MAITTNDIVQFNEDKNELSLGKQIEVGKKLNITNNIETDKYGEFINGTIIDSKTNLPVANAKVTYREQTTFTDANGNYTLKIIPQAKLAPPTLDPYRDYPDGFTWKHPIEEIIQTYFNNGGTIGKREPAYTYLTILLGFIGGDTEILSEFQPTEGGMFDPGKFAAFVGTGDFAGGRAGQSLINFEDTTTKGGGDEDDEPTEDFLALAPKAEPDVPSEDPIEEVVEEEVEEEEIPGFDTLAYINPQRILINNIHKLSYALGTAAKESSYFYGRWEADYTCYGPDGKWLKFKPIPPGGPCEYALNYYRSSKGKANYYTRGVDDNGWPYFGRGYIQLTWRDNYEKFGNLLGIDLIGNSMLSQDPVESFRIFCTFLSKPGRGSFAILMRTGDPVLARGGVNGDSGLPVAAVYRIWLKTFQQLGY